MDIISGFIEIAYPEIIVKFHYVLSLNFAFQTLQESDVGLHEQINLSELTRNMVANS